jgi:hypothetical protein
MEAYAAVGWAPIAQPPTITGISPTVVNSTGGTVAEYSHKAELISSMSTNSNTAVETDIKFGDSVDISADGTYAIIGVPEDNWSGAVHTGSSPFDFSAFPGHYMGEGSAHIFKKTGDSWAWEQQLFNPAARNLDGTVVAETRTDNSYGFPGRNFGSDVSISSDGTIVVIGSQLDGGPRYSVTENTGSADVFVRTGTTWTHEARLLPNRTLPSSSYFGRTVDITGDGSRVIIGAYNDDPPFGASNATINGHGSAHVLVRNTSTSPNTWDYEQELTNLYPVYPKVSGAQFGIDVSISNDGTRAIVGANNHRNGTAVAVGVCFIFTRNTSTNAWTYEASLLHPDNLTLTVGCNFGHDVAISGDGTRVIIGASGDSTPTDSGSAQIFVRNTNTNAWTHEKELRNAAPTHSVESFGLGVTISDDGTTVVVGAPSLFEDAGTTDSGASFIYNKSATNDWILNSRITHPTPATNDYFGRVGSVYSADLTTLAISGDGTHVIVGVPRDDITVGGVNKTDAGSVQIFRVSTPEEITDYVYDSSTQVFTATGSGITIGSTVQLQGVDGSVYSVFDTTTPNAAGTQITFKMGALGGSGGYAVAQQPYKIKVNASSGLSGISTATIAIGGMWAASPANGESLNFETDVSSTVILSATDGGGGTNRTFSVPAGNLPSELTLVPGTGVITGQLTSAGPTNVTFRVTDNASQYFEDRTFNIWGVIDLYPFNSHTFTTAGITGRLGPTFAQMKTAYNTTVWYNTPAWFNEISGKQGFQLWTVPETRTYTIKAYGSMGGHPEDGVYGAGRNDVLRGYGAWTQGDFSLTKGDKIVIIVGQEGGGLPNGGANESRGGSGGGASWVLKEDYGGSGATPSSLYLVAGGGGGGSVYSWNTDYSVANGGDSQASLITTWVAPAAGTDYNGGSGGSYGINGLDANTGGRMPYSGATGGYGQGGSTYDEPGGFGGGGGVAFHDGGGGGGYSGGIGMIWSTTIGYGGSSRNNGTNITFGVNTVYEEGKVIITRK